MSKSLKTIQTLCKVGKVLSKIVEVVCIVSLILCIVGGVCYFLFGNVLLEYANVTVNGLNIQDVVHNDIGVYAALVLGVISLLFEIILARYAYRFFRTELHIGTPFSFKVADMCKKLGIYTIVLPLVSALLQSIFEAVFTYGFAEVGQVHIETSVSLDLGIMFLILSVVLRYGAEMCQPVEGIPSGY